MFQRLQNLLRGVEPRGTSGPPERAPKANAQGALFNLFEKGVTRGVEFAPLTEIDRFVENRVAGMFLKHDVHDVELDRLIVFAEREAALDIRGTYFFMTPEHPRTRGTYNFADQIRAMKAVRDLGHELGLHIDPYYQMREQRLPLDEVLRGLRRNFDGHGIEVRIGNMHGNSVHKHPDLDGFGTSFDLFEELTRQRDFPGLARVPEQTAELIRANRVRLTDHGYDYWGDMPLWSARQGIVATNFLTDNRFGTHGTVEALVRPETTGAYYVSAHAVPGSRNLAEGGRSVPAHNAATASVAAPVSGHFAPDAPEIEALFSQATPLLMLVHPEFYC